jgi:hypothetical protein
MLLGVLWIYRTAISPFTPPTCRFHPTCSSYAEQALRKYGAVKGLILTLYRIGRCHPLGGSGYDPPRWFGEPVPNHEAGASENDPPGSTRRESASEAP